MYVEKHLDLLGKRVVDKVTGFVGVVTSVSFDLYGCVQAIVHPGLADDGKIREQSWFDIARLTVSDETPVMNRPNFISGPQARGEQGPAEKPAYSESRRS